MEILLLFRDIFLLILGNLFQNWHFRSKVHHFVMQLAQTLWHEDLN